MSENVSVRDLDKETLGKLKKKAAVHNRSLQEELKTLLKMHAGPDIEKVRAMARKSIRMYNGLKNRPF